MRVFSVVFALSSILLINAISPSNPCINDCAASPEAAASPECAHCCRTVRHRVPWHCPVEPGVTIINGDRQAPDIETDLGNEMSAACCEGDWSSKCWDTPSTDNFGHSCDMCAPCDVGCMSCTSTVSECLLCSANHFAAYTTANRNSRKVSDQHGGPCPACPSISGCNDATAQCDSQGLPRCMSGCSNPSPVVTAVPIPLRNFTQDVIVELNCRNGFFPPLVCDLGSYTTALFQLDTVSLSSRTGVTLYGRGADMTANWTGVPTGIIRSGTPSITKYLKLEPFNSNNALFLADSIAPSGLMDLVTPARYNWLFVYCMAAYTDRAVNLTVHYEYGDPTVHPIVCNEAFTLVPNAAVSMAGFIDLDSNSTTGAQGLGVDLPSTWLPPFIMETSIFDGVRTDREIVQFEFTLVPDPSSVYSAVAVFAVSGLPGLATGGENDCELCNPCSIPNQYFSSACVEPAGGICTDCGDCADGFYETVPCNPGSSTARGAPPQCEELGAGCRHGFEFQCTACTTPSTQMYVPDLLMTDQLLSMGESPGGGGGDVAYLNISWLPDPTFIAQLRQAAPGSLPPLRFRCVVSFSPTLFELFSYASFWSVDGHDVRFGGNGYFQNGGVWPTNGVSLDPLVIDVNGYPPVGWSDYLQINVKLSVMLGIPDVVYVQCAQFVDMGANKLYSSVFAWNLNDGPRDVGVVSPDPVPIPTSTAASSASATGIVGVGNYPLTTPDLGACFNKPTGPPPSSAPHNNQGGTGSDSTGGTGDHGGNMGHQNHAPASRSTVYIFSFGLGFALQAFVASVLVALALDRVLL